MTDPTVVLQPMENDFVFVRDAAIVRTGSQRQNSSDAIVRDHISWIASKMQLLIFFVSKPILILKGEADQQRSRKPQLSQLKIFRRLF